MGLNLRDVVGIDLILVGGGKVMRVEVFVVFEIFWVYNEYLEIVCRDYLYLVKIWLFDVCISSEYLEIDLLIGVDYLWSF